MAQINLEVPDEILQRLAQAGLTPTEFLQARLLEVSDESALAEKFQALAAQWRRETRYLSLMSDIVLNTAYQQIIGMGKPVVAMILQDLKQQPDHWFWALRSITGENPIRPEDRGRVGQMAMAWLEWGRQHGYQC
ncbi:hypothetical protein [Cylindrospermopsis raciborskii]|uniref:hypothetical protein n=1 Tax=Cylindrospermopsis raciborskii TaxID=77022 RepID=UPI000AC511A6|nr:hypothetical protein [Cylindrospermopsis raciborskii]MCZ2207875.1 hypothetical protein [Cylindrospermopsis raciborskii PAMP2011]NLQ06186.1 hypothetical protein [Cylindrospermopsis raciborskii MVCC19]